MSTCEMKEKDYRAWLTSRLEAYKLRWPREWIVDQIRDFVLEQPDCFERSCFLDGHVTGSAWVLSLNRERVLLTHHKKLERWLQLGGHSDGESNTQLVAKREAEEESGLAVEIVSDEIFDVDVHEIPARGAEPVHKHYDVRFLFQADDTAPLTISNESMDLRWVSLERLTDFTKEESVLRMMRKTQR